ncbi:hypothetical protein [Streptomyces sp. DH37]|uniref:hypothetical protein n=1 Tax=Streptomyces sp. DH37 TaxID=3040122 RepID=UPI00244222F5|nr:hypothetical protein [Streptomyces sp. DH37]MDG9703803.1 hypothetical protein [Streptomyces sp. DH37]
MHRAAAVACLAAGVLLLAGPGWALLALGVMLLAAAPRQEQREPVTLDAVRERARAAGAWAQQAPRRAAAAASMAVGVTGVPAGVLLLYGGGAAVLTAGGMAVVLSLLTGWNA